MTPDTWHILIPAIAGALGAPIGAWAGSLLMRRKYRAELDALEADLQLKHTQRRGSELDNVHQANRIISEVAAELRDELNQLKDEVSLLRRAVEKIPGCAMAASCPVSAELYGHTAGHTQQPPVQGN